MGTYQQKKNISKIIKVNQIVDVAFETNSIFSRRGWRRFRPCSRTSRRTRRVDISWVSNSRMQLEGEIMTFLRDRILLYIISTIPWLFSSPNLVIFFSGRPPSAVAPELSPADLRAALSGVLARGFAWDDWFLLHFWSLLYLIHVWPKNR